MPIFKTVSSNALILSKKPKHFSIFRPINIQNESKKFKKIILYITHHIFMWEEVTFKTDLTYFSKLSAQTSLFFFKKQRLRTFENSDILIEKKPRHENHFLSWEKLIFENLSKIKTGLAQFLKIVFAQMGYFG